MSSCRAAGEAGDAIEAGDDRAVELRGPADEPIRFFLPGPSYVLHRVREAQLRQPVAHRAAVFQEAYAGIAAALPRVFRTARPVVVATSSGTLMMEAAIASTVERRVLCLVNGAFSGRFLAIARALGKEADHLAVPLGRAVDPDLLREALRRGRYDAVTVAHCETATGVLAPVRELAAVVREESDALVLVDAVSSLAGAELETDAWGLDVVLTASQKALALPPGLALAAVSERAAARMAAVARRGFYTDLLRYLEKHAEGGTITTPAVTLFWSLALQLRGVLAEGMEARWARHRALRDRTLAWAAARGLEAPAASPWRSPTVTALRMPGGRASAEVLRALAARGFTIGGGYDEWKADTFRIGHMGEVRASDLEGLLAALDDALDDALSNDAPG
jgi:aspartate aminotransferase-like enzyme